MSQKERTRLGIMREIKARTMTSVTAAKVLRLGYRQMKRVWRRYQKEKGSKGGPVVPSPAKSNHPSPDPSNAADPICGHA